MTDIERIFDSHPEGLTSNDLTYILGSAYGFKEAQNTIRRAFDSGEIVFELGMWFYRGEEKMTELRLTREEWQKYDEIEKKIRELEYVLNSPSIERTLLLETRQPDPAGWTDKNYIAFVSFDPDTYIRDEIKCLKAKLKEFANAR